MEKSTMSLFILIGLAAGPHALFAQDVGERVRVTTRDIIVVGQVVEIDEDQITLSRGGSFRRIDIIGLERSAGLPSTEKRALVLGVLGGVAGAVAGSFFLPSCIPLLGSECDDDGAPILGAIVGGAVGVGVGVGIGKLLPRPLERWERIPMGGDIVASPLVDLRLRGASPAARFGARITF
ncbi:MAG: hypothetical protein OXU69_01605 [Gemmatimonadota bacterium]|nr:hypothetical protein [Gemmatimonadota bacterium]MDE2983372.1 hypothetical protein [Gemmatimonadota bacterium]